MNDDRPIKSDPKYINQFLQKINKIEVRPYLKTKKQAVLPCYQHISNSGKRQNHRTQPKTKAQIYQNIKQKNKARFGQKKMVQIKIQQKKTIRPNKITVDYKPKVYIQTKELNTKDKQNVTRHNKPPPVESEKIQYQKLLDHFKTEINNFEKQKQSFAKVTEKLKFKQMISQQNQLLFSKIKNKVSESLILQNYAQTPKNPNNDHCINDNVIQKGSWQNKKQKNRNQSIIPKTFSVKQIQKKLQKTTKQLQQLKQNASSQDLYIQQHRYDISQINILPSFDPQSIYEFIDHNKLNYNCNDSYKSALHAFYARFDKIPQREENMCDQRDQNTENSSVKTKMIGDKRVTKYSDWTEVWIPGRQRLMARKDGYKVIWLKNGDVIQDFGHEIKSYYSKAKEIYKIQYKHYQPIYYHEPLKQIWRESREGAKEVIFANGRKETIPYNTSNHL